MSYSNLTKKIFLVGIAATTAFAIDFATKWLIVNAVMKPPRVIEIAPFLNLRLGYNTGVSFGMFQDIFSAYPLLLAGLSMAIVIGILIWAVRATKFAETFALGLVAGGAIGNIVDRVRHGAVTDFLDIYVGTWHWPTFNLADVMIVSGVGLLLLSSLLPFRFAGPTYKEPDSKAPKA
ncbi:signal peptidase II [Sphingorhabdus sp. YGSMI21]|uniref:signal peptidase II n=1 Tax=Sphingorhabdus sp. YGSMI21 TaxID=2077182 RepID=UPI000C1EB7A0|nr:signal peptidase II [Sphingorhabdus sp. YGSMI21]ATW05729.1 signal peptidase II [Sphingorhabdus sp. YGSMI21]